VECATWNLALVSCKLCLVKLTMFNKFCKTFFVLFYYTKQVTVKQSIYSTYNDTVWWTLWHVCYISGDKNCHLSIFSNFLHFYTSTPTGNQQICFDFPDKNLGQSVMRFDSQDSSLLILSSTKNSQFLIYFTVWWVRYCIANAWWMTRNFKAKTKETVKPF
jgi:hypothetical protein